jgi:hypothetical protein
LCRCVARTNRHDFALDIDPGHIIGASVQIERYLAAKFSTCDHEIRTVGDYSLCHVSTFDVHFAL